MPSRYESQTCLAEVGHDGQQRLRQSRVLMVGAGGLASPALLYLTGAGIGHIGIMDGDRVSESNLQRQVLFQSSQIGQLKTESAKKNLQGLNPDTHIELYSEYLSVDNAIKVFSQYDLILDGTDNFETKYLINDAAYKTGKTVIFASVTAMDGQVAIFNPNRGGPCYRCLYPNQKNSRIQNCNVAGVMGSVVGIIGSMQATEAIKFLLAFQNDSPLAPLENQMITLDARDMTFYKRKILKNENCEICQKPSKDVQLENPSFLCESQFAEVTYSTFKNNSKPFRLIDVREPHEWSERHLELSENLPLSQLQSTEMLDATLMTSPKTLLLYCKSGIRSKTAAFILSERGLKNLAVLKGGIDHYTEQS